VVISNLTMQAGASESCSTTGSIVVGPNVALQNGSYLNLSAPTVRILPSFNAHRGSTLNVQ
jgi:hypothetical protein